VVSFTSFSAPCDAKENISINAMTPKIFFIIYPDLFEIFRWGQIYNFWLGILKEKPHKDKIQMRSLDIFNLLII
jgi:hypothetical protein